MHVVSFQDGDTLTVVGLDGCRFRHRLRLADIDAPEKNEPLHDDSRMSLAELCRSGPLRYEFSNVQSDAPDPMNRLVVYLYAGDLLINAEQVSRGMACLWTPRGPGQHAPTIRAAQDAAQRDKLGIWQYPAHRLCSVYERAR